MTPYEYLQKKGMKKIHQPWKRYNLSIEELVGFLNEYSEWKNVSVLDTYKKMSKDDEHLPISFSNDTSRSYTSFFE